MDVNNCKKCSELCDNRKQIVNGEGDKNATILFIGEAPGKQEDLEGRPFIGKSGKILRENIDKFIKENYRITNSVRCKPPDNRDPTSDELNNCKTHLENEIQKVNPDMIVCLGSVSCKNILGSKVSVIKKAGEIKTINLSSKEIEVVICPHPASTLYNNNYEDVFKETMKKVQKKVNST